MQLLRRFVVITAVLATVAAACEAPPSPTTTVEQAATTSTPPPAGSSAGDRLEGLPLWALVDGNDAGADRINLVFAGWGWDDPERFVETATRILSWDGHAYRWDDDGDVVIDASARALGADLGVFAIEPWRSHRDRFNVWYTDAEPETPVAWLNGGEPPFRLPDQTVVVLGSDTDRFDPDLGSVAGLDVVFSGPDAPVRPEDHRPFANLLVVVPSAFPAGGLRDLPHELGHAMFDLADEYVGQINGYDGRPDLSSWPSCAEDESEARAWWVELEGEVDPMVTIWVDEMAVAGFAVGDVATLEPIITVGYVDGGCYGVSGSIRATEDSLMNGMIPVMGSVNRRWSQQILDLWDGAARE